MTILNLMKVAESSSKREQKTLWAKEKLLVMGNFSFSQSIFKRVVLQTYENKSLEKGYTVGLAQRKLCPAGYLDGRVPDLWPRGCQFSTRLWQSFTAVIFHLSPLMFVRKVVSGFGKKILSRLVWESQETHRCITDRHDNYDLSCWNGV